MSVSVQTFPVQPPRAVAPVRRVRNLLLYVLHSGQLYGTERMALATAQGLADEYQTIFLAPRGEALREAQRLGFQTRRFKTVRQLAEILRPLLRENTSLTYVSTGPRYSLACIVLNAFYRRRIRHVFVAHGSGKEADDYRRVKFLSPFDVNFVAVSDYVKEKLVSHGLRADRIEVVTNFLPRERIAGAYKREPFTAGVKSAISVGRIAGVKRFDLLVHAMDRRPELADFPIDAVGGGPMLEALRQRAQKQHTALHFVGFKEDIDQRYAKSDLLIHTCPTEPFGLVIIEAMAANVPVLVPDQGGASKLVEDGVSGFKYRAGDADHLARRLVELRNADPKMLNRVVAAAAEKVRTRFSQEASLGQYRRLFAPPV
jgi:glycosyltransferase involved in cell wall biosynthesis